MKVGLVTFDFPPQYRRADVAPRPTAVDTPLARLLEAHGVDLVVPLADLMRHDPNAAGGIRDSADVAFCVDTMKARQVDCLLIDVFHWARLALATQLVNALGVPPSLLFTAMPCNHGSLTEGRLAREVEVFCAYAGLPVYRCDDAESVHALLRDRRQKAGERP